MNIKKSKDLPWDEMKAGMRIGWAIGQAVQMTTSVKEIMLDRDEMADASIRYWTHYFLIYADEVRDELIEEYNAREPVVQQDSHRPTLAQLAAQEAREHPNASKGISLGTNKGGTIRRYNVPTNHDQTND